MSDEAPNKTERKLRRTGSKQNLRGVVGDTDADDIEVFGYELVYTTGEFTIDRDTLLEQAKSFGIPEWQLPSETMPHNAFGYAMGDLLDAPDMPGGDLHEIEFEGQRVQFTLRQNDSKYSYTLDASVYYPPEMTSSDTGEWVAVENDEGKQGLGVIEYDSDNRDELRFVDRVGEDMALAPIWFGSDDRTGFKQRAQHLYEKHIESHRGKDVNNMTYYLVDNWTDSIKLRDACYFVPANHVFTRYDGETQRFTFDEGNEDWRQEVAKMLQMAEAPDDADHVGYSGSFRVEDQTVENDQREVVAEVEREYPIEVLVDAYQQLYEWLNLHAEKPMGAQDTHLDVIEIVDTERQRKMVERKAEKKMEQQAEKMAGTVIDRLRDDDTMVEDIIDEVSETMDELAATAGEYDDLLVDEAQSRSVRMKRENAIRRAVSNAMGDLGDDEAELVEEVLAEVEGAPADAVDDAAVEAAT